MADFIQRSPFKMPGVPAIDVYSFFKPLLQKYRTKDAIIDTKSQKTYTYSELEDAIERVAYNLHKRGVRKGDTIALFTTNSWEYVVMTLATWRIGAILCVANHLLTSHELNLLLSIVEPVYMFTDTVRLQTVLEAIKDIASVKMMFVREACNGYASFDTLTEPTLGQTLPAVTDIAINDTASIFFSSGTTGLPKAVMISHKNLVSAIVWWTQPYIFVPNRDYQVVFQPFSHVYGMLLVTTGMAVGAAVIPMEQFELVQFLEHVTRYEVKKLALVPPLVVLLTKDPVVDNYDLSHIKDIICGAAPLGEDTIDELRKRLKTPIHFGQGYGLTETTGCATLSPKEQDSDSPVSYLSPRSVGYPFGEVEIKVVDIKTGKNLGPEQPGEICCRGPMIMIGYAKNPSATASTFDDEGWFHTGDVGYYKKDRSFYIVDRLKELIKYKGYQVAPAELEDLLLSHPLVADCAVIGLPDVEAGELPLALIVRKDASLREKDIIDFVAEKAAPYKRLRGGVKFVDIIPKSGSGKILRSQIKKSFTNFKGNL